MSTIRGSRGVPSNAVRIGGILGAKIRAIQPELTSQSLSKKSKERPPLFFSKQRVTS